MGFDPILGPVGLFLLYVAPGLGLAVAVFPEKLHRQGGWEGPIEIAVLAVVASVAITILIGSALAATPAGFSSTWSSPTLLLGDALIAVGGGIVGGFRWAQGSDAGSSSEAEEARSTWGTLQALEALAHEERQVRRTLRHQAPSGPERSALQERLEELRAEQAALRRAREAELAS
jgi:hypothetical protein